MNLNTADILRKGGFIITCDQCSTEFPASRARLFDARAPMPKQVESVFKSRDKQLRRILKGHIRKQEKLTTDLAKLKLREKGLAHRKGARPKIVQVITKWINFGQIIEKIFPSTRHFAFNMADCRSMFDPIDYIAFNGWSDSGAVKSISFIEVKTGEANLQRNQNQIKRAIRAGKVHLRTY